MTKYEIIDWWLDKQKSGFASQDQLTVKELIYIQDHKEQCCNIKNLLQRDKPDILRRMANGERTMDIVKEYNMSMRAFHRNIEIKKGDRIMNIFTGIGRTTKDGELNFAAGSGTAILKFSMAIDRRFKNKNGEKETDFFNCIMFGKSAEGLAPYILKGKMIGINGSLQTGSYEKDGIKRYTTDIIVNEVQFLDSKKDSATETKPTGVTEVDYTNDSEELPF